MTPSKCSAVPTVKILQQVLDRFLFVTASELLCGNLKQSMKLILVRIFDFDSIRDSPQERLIDQIRWLQVGRENDQLLKWN
ncbi:MAG: hypothetical protein ACK58T_43980, partial [Phycisphaerae bacterium]